MNGVARIRWVFNFPMARTKEMGSHLDLDGSARLSSVVFQRRSGSYRCVTHQFAGFQDYHGSRIMARIHSHGVQNYTGSLSYGFHTRFDCKRWYGSHLDFGFQLLVGPH